MMGVTVREGLRRLCADGGWSYAVLWRTAESGGVRHLVWGEGHCQTSRDSSISGFHQLGDCKFQEDDGVGAVVEKMKSEVHVVGYGLIGCAALTGNYRWINHNALLTEGYTSAGFVEINHHFRSGIQTIAVIPVLPCGVVQLGSIHMIMEDIGFVNRVRCLVLQLGCLLGELIFDGVLDGSHQNVRTGVDQLIGESVDRQSIKIPSSSCVAQSSCSSISEISGSRILTCGEMPLVSNSAITTASNSITELQLPKIVPMISSLVSLAGEQQSQFWGNCVPSDLCILTKQQSVPHDIKSDNKFMPSAIDSRFSRGFTFIDRLSSSISDNPTNNRSYLDKSAPLHLDSHTYSVGSYSQSSIMVPSIGTREFHESACDPGKLVSPTGSHQTKGASALEGPSTFATISCGANYSTNKHALAGNASTHCIPSTDCYFKNTNASKDHNVQDEAFQNSCSNSLKNLSATCLKNISSQGHIIEGVNPDHGIKELQSGAFSQNSPCFTVEKRLSAHTISSVPMLAENAPDMLIVRKSGNDLFDALGLYDRPVASNGSLDCLFANMRNTDAWESCSDVSGCMSQLDTNTIFDGSTCGTSSEAFPDSRQDQLLDAVVSKVNLGAHETSTDDLVSITTQSKVVDCSFYNNPSKHGQQTSSGQLQPDLFGISPSLVETGMICSSVKSSCSMAEIGDYYSGEGYKTQVSLWTENDQNIKSDNASLAQFKKVDEMGKLNRKRSKPGESPRPRPKDRQMIQDRVKELREIVPNGAKLSIDALLERTIKHMLFLQSVTKHADKLKEIGEPKIISKEGGLLLKDNFEGGATWAFEVGSQTMICPIIVEDLNPPRQLLVEMLCEERGFFLEIADLIRGLGLTILKGVMEARSDKVWARFAVEANRDITRMDIFLSLVQLLEPRTATDVPPQGFDSTNMATNMS